MSPSDIGTAAEPQAPAGGDDEEEEEFGIAFMQEKVKTSKGTTSHDCKGGGKEAYEKDGIENMTEAQFAEEAHKIFKADVMCFSAAQDHQTAADVGNVADFGLLKVSKQDPKSAAGGACTNAIQQTLRKRERLKDSAVAGLTKDLSFGDLLVEMHHVLKDMGYSQNPALSCSRQIDLRNEKFCLVNPKEAALLERFEKEGATKAVPRKPRRKALIIGINYTNCGDPDAILNGCVNDAKTAYAWIEKEGWNVKDPECVHFLSDDPTWTMGEPTGKVVLEALQWLVKDAHEGDSLFMHFSGHGIQLPELYSGKEADGFDEAMAALDYNSGGLIRDEVLFKTFVVLPEGVRLVVIADCCHSQSILDLAHVFEANDQNLEEYLKGGFTRLMANSLYSFGKMQNWTKEAASGLWDGAKDLLALTETAKRYFQKHLSADKCCSSWSCCSGTK